MSHVSQAMERAQVAGWVLPDDETITSPIAGALESFHPASGRDVRTVPVSTRPETVTQRAAAVAPLGRLGSAAEPLRPHVAGLVQRLFLSPEEPHGQARSVLFAGVTNLDKSGLVSAAAGEVLAGRVVGRVCLVDANIAAPSLHACYGQPNQTGLVQAMNGPAPSRTYARRLANGDQNSLWLVATGETATPTLTADAGVGPIRDLIGAFDYVVLSGPSFSESPTAVCMLGGLVDGIVLVVEANHTPRRAARAAVEALRASGARVLGTVLNNRTFPIPDGIYRHL